MDEGITNQKYFCLSALAMAPTGPSNLPFAQTFASSAIAACTAEVRCLHSPLEAKLEKPTLLYADQGVFTGLFV